MSKLFVIRAVNQSRGRQDVEFGDNSSRKCSRLDILTALPRRLSDR